MKRAHYLLKTQNYHQNRCIIAKKNMNYLEVKQEIKKEFNVFLKPLGYKYKSESQGCLFTLDHNGQQIRITISIANYIDEFRASVIVRSSNYQIQKIQNAIFEEKGICDTFAFSIANYFKETNYDFPVKSLLDILEWRKIAEKYYLEYVVPLLEKYRTV